jgi:platelet-activating factor acetylhydrolase
MPFRYDQLLFRRHEVYLAYSAFHSLVEHGHHMGASHLQTIDNSDIDWQSWSKRNPSGLAPVKCDAEVALVGHSFGAATVVSALCVRYILDLAHLRLVLGPIESASKR